MYNNYYCYVIECVLAPAVQRLGAIPWIVIYGVDESLSFGQVLVNLLTYAVDSDLSSVISFSPFSSAMASALTTFLKQVGVTIKVCVKFVHFFKVKCIEYQYV